MGNGRIPVGKMLEIGQACCEDKNLAAGW